MKNLYSLVLLLGFPFLLTAQTIHGIWTGTLVNDSTHHTQNFELGLSEYRGKITGYTYTTFIDNDTFYYSIKRIKAERKDGKLVIEDDEMVGNNFPERAAKHVKQITTFPLINDTTIDISNGRWSTNQTRKYYSIGGSATVRVQDDEQKSDLLAHLEEANIKTDIAVAKKIDEKEDKPVVKKSAPVIPQKNNNGKIPENKNTDVAKNLVEQPEKTRSTPQVDAQKNNEQKISENKMADVAKNSNEQSSKTKPAPGVDVQKDDPVNSVAVNKQTNTPVVRIDENKDKPSMTNTVSTQVSIAANRNSIVPQKNDVSISQPVSQTKASIKKDTTTMVQKKEPSVDKNPEVQKEVSSAVVSTPVSQRKELIRESKQLPAIVGDRKNENIQDIYFKGDSLVLALYDNGIVDGDTVSVFLNGESIISKQMLKASALKKTIYIPAMLDSVQLVLFAENLGSIPPNTGLLTVRDGDDIYQVRFSADLQKNASITLRRKR